LQATILGSIAAAMRPVSTVNALTGLGYTFTSANARAMLLRPILSALLRLLLNRPKQLVLVQNPDDRDSMLSLGVAPGRIATIPGSGVNVDMLQPHPEPPGAPTIAFVGRLLADNGIRTLIEAHRLLRERGTKVELLIAGTPDPANPASVSAQEVAGWSREAGITWLGHVDDMLALWARAHIVVLPSRREGLPKSLLEAAACGRPMIATDVPGCREIVIPGETGLLVPYEDPPSLARAIETLETSPALRSSYGRAARRLTVARFSAEAIGRQAVDLHRNLVERGGPT
jgi:glycosyltransferase involved in cell wall biosynthesis